LWINLFLVLALVGSNLPAWAQEEQPWGPFYVVQAGDTLGDIASRFSVSLQALMDANQIANANLVSEGQRLVIPGLEGIQGELTTSSVAFGEHLRSLSRRYQVPVEALARLNHLTSPFELFAGSNLIIPQNGDSPVGAGRALLEPGQSLLELAVLKNTNPWRLVQSNALENSWSTVAGDVLLLPAGEAGPGALPGEIQAVEIAPLPFRQGRTGEIRIAAPASLTLSGDLMGRALNFFPDGSGSYIAMHGVHAMSEPGLYTLTLRGKLADGAPFAFAQQVGLRAVDYPQDRPLTVDPATIDPAVTRPEDAQWTALAQPATPQRLWQGAFRLPSPLSAEYCLESGDCWTSRFGNRRSYNGSPYNFFHTGLDIAGGTGTEIYAPADGVVVFAGPLTVRGNATMIDHGWGVYTGYMHQSELRVKAGDTVKAGQMIGLVGATGRVEGPHLHWEVWVGGVQVDPLDWLRQVYP